jgi:hypothetical protein
MDILTLIEASHTLGRDKGFWKKDKDLREEILYIFSNIGDIAKAFKKNNRSDWERYDRLFYLLEDDLKTGEITQEVFSEKSREFFQSCIKNTFEDEITNVILRVTDLIGGKKISITSCHPWTEEFLTLDLNGFFMEVRPQEEYKGNLPYWLNDTLAACMFSSDTDKDYGLFHILFHLGSIINYYNINIEKQVVKKIEYNRLRPLLYVS